MRTIDCLSMMKLEKLITKCQLQMLANKGRLCTGSVSIPQLSKKPDVIVYYGSSKTRREVISLGLQVLSHVHAVGGKPGGTDDLDLIGSLSVPTQLLRQTVVADSSVVIQTIGFLGALS